MTEHERQEELKMFESKIASPYTDEIIRRVISNSEPCVLVLPTGSGKSTVVPYAFIKSGFRVILSEPTVALCQNIVRSFKFMFPTVKTGTAFGREVDIPKDARFIVCTNGNLKQRLLGYIKNGTCASIGITDVIILDEVHFGLLDTQIIITLWYYCRKNFSSTVRLPRLVLSSATVSKAIYSRLYSPCVVLPDNLNKSFPIEIKWSEKDYSIEGDERYRDMGDLVSRIHLTTKISERILIFIPGNREQEAVLKSITGLQQGVDFDLVLINSKSLPEDSAPLDRKIDERRLIIMATPSGDAGLTISNLVHVIDSLLVKNNYTSPNGTETLVTEIASKQLFTQRMGRVGRTAPGIYYPMCTRDFSENNMPEGYGLEILRVPIYQLIIDFVSHGIPIKETLGIYDIPSLEINVNQLITWGMIRQSPVSGVLFPSSGGAFMSHLGIDNPRLAGVLYGWLRLGKPVKEGVIVTQLIANFTSQMLKIPVFEIEDKRDLKRLTENFIQKNYSRFLGPSDVHTAIRIWNALHSEISSVSADASERWCQINNLQYSNVKTTIKNISQMLPRAQHEADRISVKKGLPLSPKSESQSWTIDEKSVIFSLRRLMEYIYVDEIVHRNKHDQGKVIFVSKDGSTMSPSLTKPFSKNIFFPSRIIVIGKRKLTFPSGEERNQITQFLDIDNPNEIEDISTVKLMEELGIFTKSFS